MIHESSGFQLVSFFFSCVYCAVSVVSVVTIDFGYGVWVGIQVLFGGFVFLATLSCTLDTRYELSFIIDTCCIVNRYGKPRLSDKPEIQKLFLQATPAT